MDIDIRPFSRTDHPVLQAITWHNRRGFLGDDGEQAWFTDPPLFYELFVAGHPRFEPQLAHLAVDRASRQVLGYVVGTSDVAALDRWHLVHHVPRLLGVALGTVARRTAHPTLRTVARLRPMLRAATSDRRRLHDQLAAHPASLHINLLPSARRTGVGSRLLATLEQQLRLLAVPGIQLSTSSTLPDAQPFYEARGYRAIDDSPAPHPYLGDYRVVTMVKRLAPATDAPAQVTAARSERMSTRGREPLPRT